MKAQTLGERNLQPLQGISTRLALPHRALILDTDVAQEVLIVNNVVADADIVPDDGVGERLPSLAAPDDRCLTLVRDACE